MNILIDLILVAVIVVSAILAAKKGFIGTLANLLALFTAIVLSVILSTPVADYIDNNYVNPYVKGYVLGVIDSSSIGKKYDEAIMSVDVSTNVEQMPPKLKDVIEFAGIDVNQIIEKAAQVKDDANETKDRLINAIADPISNTVSRVVSVVSLFIIFSVLLWLVARVITLGFNKISIGKKINIFGGTLFGIARGVAIVFVISFLFSAIAKTVPTDSNNIFSKKTIDSTIVLKKIIDLNPLDSIVKF